MSGGRIDPRCRWLLARLPGRVGSHGVWSHCRRGPLRIQHRRQAGEETCVKDALVSLNDFHFRSSWVKRWITADDRSWNGRALAGMGDLLSRSKRSVQFFYVETHPLLTNVIFLH